MFINAFVIAWRESLEALLIVVILIAWANTQARAAQLRRAVGGGVAGGVVLALVVAALAVGAGQWLSGDALDSFQIVLLFATWAMITQMVLWMHHHGRSLRAELNQRAANAGSALGLALVAGMAVAREGIETVMFLFGAFVQAQGVQVMSLAAGAVAGLLLAVITALVGVRGAKRIPLRLVFRISEVLLIVVAGAMLANGIDRILARDWLPQLADTVWDSSALLDDTQGLGQTLANFAGYRAQPSVALLMAFPAFWFFVVWRMRARPAGC
jgi:high-affinity iron transporter